ncbi:MAG: hypothetical protein ACT4QG_10840 [Sporichthyaceae bacterium]
MIETLLPGSTSQARYASVDLELVQSTVVEVEEALRWVQRNREEAWTGSAAQAFSDRVEWLLRQVADVRGDLSKASKQLESFAAELDAAEDLLAAARRCAADAGLTVIAEGVLPPTERRGVVGPIAAPSVGALGKAYEQCAATVAQARRIEDQANADLQRTLADTCAVPVWQEWLEKAGILPPQNLGTAGNVLYGTGLAVVGTGVAVDWATKVRYGRFVLRDATGRFVSTQGMGFGQKVGAAWSKNAWQATAHNAATRGNWLKGGKLVGPAGGVVQGGIGFLDQWKADADDPSLRESERYGRAGFHGALEGGGSWALAAAGAKGGGAIGFAIGGPPGAVAGAAIGGVLGGLAGSEVGGWVADVFDEPFGSGVGAAVDGVKSLGSAVKFW